MKKAIIIVGTRPEAIKLIPLYKYLKEHKEQLYIEPTLISTGQHKEMLDQIFDFFEVQPEYSLNIMRKNQSLNELASKLIKELDAKFTQINPNIVIVQGDTTSAFAGSLASYYGKIKIAHVEAGLRTYDRFSPYPEEANRQMIGSMADYHFTPTEKASENLILEQKKEVICVGNTVIDSLMLCLSKVKSKEAEYKTKFVDLLDLKSQVLVTGHRRENFGKGFKNICESLKLLATKHEDTRFIYPVHLNPNVQQIVKEKLSEVKNISLIEPLPYDELVFLMSKSFMILTDSGGIQEEAPSLGIPLLVMRDTTERPEGISAGCAQLVGTEKDAIVNAYEKIVGDKNLYNQMSNVPNPYGDGHSSKRIAKHLATNL